MNNATKNWRSYTHLQLHLRITFWRQVAVTIKQQQLTIEPHLAATTETW